MKGKTHGQAIKIYLGLLRTNEAFRGEVDGLIAGGKYKDAISDWRILNIFRSENNKVPTTNSLFGGSYSDKTLSGSSGSDSGSSDSNSSNGAGILGGALSVIGGLFGAKQGEAAGDIAYYETLAAQKRADTTKILIISGVTLGIIGLSVFMVIKLKK